MDITDSDRALVVAEQKMDRVRELHRERHFAVCDTGPRCAVCDTEWPCPTVAILDSDDTPKCRECSCEGFQLSPRGLCDGCEEYVSFNERNDTDDTTKGGR
jgi:hypothetical protein